MASDPWSHWNRWYRFQIPLELRPVRILIHVLEVRESELLLDLGTGTALLLRELAGSPHRPRTAVGIDRSAEMLARAPALPEGWGLIEADATALPFEDASFDVITACYLLHLLDPEMRRRLLAEAARVLVPGGRLGTVTVAPPAGGLSLALSRPIRALAGRSRGVLSGLRPLDPRPDLLAAGLHPVESRRTFAGYPSLCVVAQRGR
jgi:ubiquinone/menaquinone biosynthesis C-methylase UbiE